ncbi:MAG: beta-galactosidase, partial [Candidatus Omnitrophica bacterium]|nr:beta-galactosidase [Candidatus Omnitrophota bacterium]
MKKNKTMVLKNGQYYLNDKPFFLYSGEIHYFRTPSEKWSTYLRMAREAGLNTVATYIPWRWHEYEEGKFDFTGRTIKERNLLGFLKKCEEEGLFVVLRAGPMCHGEIMDDGLPAWLLDNYPEIRLKKADGSLFRGAMISFLHPAYLQFVRKWYEKIIPLIAARQVTAGGRVIAVQLDNEISMINWLTKVPDASKTAMSLYHNFLREKYGSIKELNAAFGCRYKNFSRVKYPPLAYSSQPDISYWVWVDFMREFYASYYEFLAKEVKAHGIDVPLIANIAHFADFDVRGRGICSPMTSSMFTSFPKKVDNLVLGGAYQMRRLDYENFHDVAITTEVVKMISNDNAPIMCVEMQSGVMFDRPVLYPPDVDLNILTSIAHGLNGLNA